MLQSLTNYLLGGTTTTNSNTGRAGGVDTEDNSADRVALRTTDHDDGWTMVDRDSEGNSDGDSSEEEEIDTVNDDEDGLERVRLERADSAESILYVHVQDMEESWFVTPPPCFSSQTGPIQLVTSPLENLLIEHPSMSVYQGPQYVPGAPNESPLELEEFIDIMEQELESGDVAHGRRNYLPLPLTKLQKAKTRSAQKVQLKKSAQQATRGYTNRSNKAREVNGRNWNSRRKERCQGSNRSHANNNRKC